MTFAHQSQVNYRDPDNWLALPAGGGERGSAVPTPATSPTSATQPASATPPTPPTPPAPAPFDVFYVCPTTCYRDDIPHCEVDDPTMRKGALKKLEQQGSIFSAGNLYAPYYRQLCMPRFLELRSIPAILAEVARICLVDVQAAFLQYLEERDAGRPLVFAGHSQGSIILLALLPWLREVAPEVLERTIAAYLVGFTVTPKDCARIGLPFATGAADTGVVISYNTEKVGTTGFNPLVISSEALVINPVNWRFDETPAPREQSLGSRLPDAQGVLTTQPQFADARINLERRTLTTTAPLETRPPWPPGVLHSQDLMLYYHDLKANVALRVATWFE